MSDLCLRLEYVCSDTELHKIVQMAVMENEV